MTTVANVRVFDGYRVLEGTWDVRFEDGTITSLTPAESGTKADGDVDGTGRTLLPGLIDAHVHLTKVEELEELASWGVTTGLDMSIWSEDLMNALRNASGRATETGATAALLSAGISLAGANSTHANIPGFPEEALISSPEQMVQRVRTRKEQGVDYLKLILSAHGITREEGLAGVEEAHRLGLKVVAHAATVTDYRLAVELGVDVVTHAPLDGPLDAELLDGLVGKRQTVVPTLSMMKGVAQNVGGNFAFAQDAVRRMHDAQVFTMAGTDANQAPGVPASVKHGSSLHEELLLMAEAGFTPVQALTSATASTAEFFDLADRGRIREGLRADLLLVEGDPTQDLASTQKISGAWVDGHAVSTKTN